MNLTRHLAEARGFFTRAEALDDGLTDRDIRASLRAKVIVRLRHGYYQFADLWEPLTPEERHLALARSVAHRLGPAVALSHVSAALMHGISTWGIPLNRVHVTRLDGGSGRVEAGVVHHLGVALGDDVTEVDGVRVVRPDRAVLETACTATPESALVSLDSYLHQELGTQGDLRKRFETMGHWPRTRHLHIPIRMADSGAASPGESRGRWMFRVHHVPPPVLQFEVYDSAGRFVGTSDWGWPEYGLLGEFDGRIKYGRLLKPGQRPEDVVVAEKIREDQMREAADSRMIRLIWEDYDRQRVTCERVMHLLRRAS